MKRRESLKILTAASAWLGSGPLLRATVGEGVAESVEDLPRMEGSLTLYLGRGEGGLYEKILDAIREKNPDLKLIVRRGPSSALANTLVAEENAGGMRADLFWAIDSGSIGRVVNDAEAVPLPKSIRQRLKPGFRFPSWAPISGRVRTVPYNPERVQREDIPKSIMEFPERDIRVGWAPSYGAFQSFVTAMRLLEGEEATHQWLLGMREKARAYAGEFGVVMAVQRGEVDLGFANHYYSLRLQKARPEAPIKVAFTPRDAGSLLNVSGLLLLNRREESRLFMRYLLSREVQQYLSREAYEIPMVGGVKMPEGLPPLRKIDPPKVDVEALADLRPTLDLLRETGVL